MFRTRLSAAAGFLLLLLLFSGPVAAQPLAAKVREHRFANGLQLLMVPRRQSPTFTAYITIGVGSVNETSANRGVAHLLEHLLFKGTKTIGTTDYKREKPLLEEIERTGAALDRLRAGPHPDPQRTAALAALAARLKKLQREHRPLVVKDELSRIYAENGAVGYNAFTSRDLTTYQVSLPANKLELWASLEADRMQNAVLREFYTERAVVMEERRRSYDTNPAGMLYETLVANAYTMHPYRHPVIGWMSDIAHLSLAQARAFHDKYYAPVNTVIALVGDFDPQRAVALVGHYFGAIAPGTPVPPVIAEEPPQHGEKRVHVAFDAQPQLAVAYHKPTLPARADFVFDLIDQILAGGRSSRLYRTLVEEKQLATAVSTYGTPGARYPNLFVISAVPRYPHTCAEVLAAIDGELARLASEPVSSRELETARNHLRTGRLRHLQDNEGLAGMLSYYQSVAGDWRYLVSYDRIAAGIGADEVREVARRWLRPENRTVATLGRGGEEP